MSEKLIVNNITILKFTISKKYLKNDPTNEYF